MSGLVLIGSAADFQTPSADAPDWEHLVFQREYGAQVVAIDRLPQGKIDRLFRAKGFDLGSLWRLGTALRGASTLLAQSEQSGYEAALALRLRLSRQSLFIIFHGHRWWTRRNRVLGKLAGRMPNVRFLCLSASLSGILRDEYGVPAERVLVTGYGADDEFFRPRSGLHTSIVSAGSASRDYRALAEACRNLQATVRVAADSTWYPEPSNVEAAEIPSNMQMFSCGSYQELRDLYAASLFVVVPLLDVRFACGYAVIAEAMAMGKAVIVSRTHAPSDLVEDGVTGLYVPPGDPAALTRAMAELLDDPARAIAMGEAARRATAARWNLRAYVSRLAAAMSLPSQPELR